MAIAEAFSVALGVLLDPVNLAMLVAIVIVGQIMGFLPGLGSVTGLALLVPFTFGLDPLTAFMLLAALKGSTTFGGSLSAILINTPGQASNAATILDGYPMARSGRAGEAIGAAAMASAAGAVFGIIILVVTIPFITQIVLLFGPTEVFWLGIWGLSTIAVVVKGDAISGLVSAAVGLLLAMHGVNLMSSFVRWDYGIHFMVDGFKLVPAIIGIFAIAEMINLLTRGGTIAEAEEVDTTRGVFKGMKAVFDHKGIFLRSSIIGVLIGIIPGIGGALANYVAYFHAVQVSSDSSRFGKGDVRGVIASEGSNDAKDGGALVTTLAFGIPGSTSMAILLGAFVLHGIVPGPRLYQDHLDIVAMIILALLFSNILTSAIGVTTSKWVTKITRIDIRILAPVIIITAFYGSFVVNNNIYDIFLTIFFGLIGIVMIKTNISRVPLILGLILGPIIEENFFRSLQISGGEYGIFIESPLAIGLILLTVVSLFSSYIKVIVARFDLVPRIT